jgi:hypothetical protein
MVKQPQIHIDLDELNHSELVALCQWVDIDASRAWPRHLLIEALEQFQSIDLIDPIDSYRDKMSSWLKRYWDRVQMQASKKVCPNCHLCRDAQVVECYNKNRKWFDPRARGK